MEEVVIERLSEEELKQRDVFGWPIWEKEVSSFPWIYDSTEECLIINGEVEIITQDKIYKLNPGDFVTFNEGLVCTWNILSNVKKHYNFP